MSKRTTYTVVTPLPATISRETAVDALHNHAEMIQLNPLVTLYAPTTPPPNSPPDEFHCAWYTLTDRISYLPGIKGSVTYKACFHDLPRGLQTHVYAPAGLEIKDKWSIGGNEPGEEREVLELGLVGVPREGLYLREDVDLKCNFMMTSFVRKNLDKSHKVLVERLLYKADLKEDKKYRQSLRDSRGHSLHGSITRSFSGTSGPQDQTMAELDGSPIGSPRVSELGTPYADDKSPWDRKSSFGGQRSPGIGQGFGNMPQIGQQYAQQSTHIAELPADKGAARVPSYHANDTEQHGRHSSNELPTNTAHPSSRTDFQ